MIPVDARRDDLVVGSDRLSDLARMRAAPREEEDLGEVSNEDEVCRPSQPGRPSS